MIFGETTEAMVTRLCTPHLWFAWYPVILDDGRAVWLEYVIRYRTRYDATSCSALWNFDVTYQGWDQ